METFYENWVLESLNERDIMSTATLRTFKEKVGSVAITLSQFLDRNGVWAKELATCAQVYIEFEDMTMLHITKAEYESLNATQKDYIRHARSSPPV